MTPDQASTGIDRVLTLLHEAATRLVQSPLDPAAICPPLSEAHDLLGAFRNDLPAQANSKLRDRLPAIVRQLVQLRLLLEGAVGLRVGAFCPRESVPVSYTPGGELQPALCEACLVFRG
jgi:hypothetical protein